MNTWLQSRTATLTQKLQSVGTAALHGSLPSASLKDGVLHLDRLEKAVPDGADTLVLKLYSEMAPVRITDVLLEVDHRLCFAVRALQCYGFRTCAGYEYGTAW